MMAFVCCCVKAKQKSTSFRAQKKPAIILVSITLYNISSSKTNRFDKLLYQVDIALYVDL